MRGGVKGVGRILEKGKGKKIGMDEIERMEDIGGLGIMWEFVEDIEVVKKMLE